MSVSCFVFSDESGSWHSGPFYVRSWVKVRTDEYERLKSEVARAKSLADVRELKYDNFVGNERLFSPIFSLDFSVFVSLSVPNHFANRTYTILQTLLSIDVAQSTGGEQLTESIKNKVVNSAKNILFFVYFEKQHIRNSVTALVAGMNADEFEYRVDIPQCQPKEWEAIARECGVPNVKIVRRSEDYPGVELADVIAGCIYRKIRGDTIANQIYQRYIRSKMTDMASTTCPNPNLVFFQDFSETERAICAGFR